MVCWTTGSCFSSCFRPHYSIWQIQMCYKLKTSFLALTSQSVPYGRRSVLDSASTAFQYCREADSTTLRRTVAFHWSSGDGTPA